MAFHAEGNKVAEPVVEDGHRGLEVSIGREVRRFRRRVDLTVTELSSRAGMSPGMLSKVENGIISPSLATLQSLSAALDVPVTAFFRGFEEQRDASFVGAGKGLKVERRGTSSGHEYQLLGHSFSKSVTVEPTLVEITAEADIFPTFQHPGSEFIYMLSGVMTYHHGGTLYKLKRGDSLLFDAATPHGPQELVKTPIRFLSIISYAPLSKD